MHVVEAGHSFVDAMPDHAGTSAQRIRIGLTSLAIVFLIVLLASAITRAGRDDRTNSANASANQSEPLAELGVAPGSPEATNNIAANKK